MTTPDYSFIPPSTPAPGAVERDYTDQPIAMVAQVIKTYHPRYCNPGEKHALISRPSFPTRSKLAQVALIFYVPPVS